MIILTYKIFDFSTPDSNKGWRVDKESFLKLINSKEFKDDLEKRRLLGGLTHKCRDEFDKRKCPSVGSHFDWLITHPDLNNVVIDLRVEGDSVYADLLVLDTPKGKLTQLMHSTGTKFEVSVSTYSQRMGNTWKFMKFNGIDMCGTGALNTELEAVNLADESGNKLI